MTKQSSFSFFMAIFMRNCPQFWGSKGIYMFESYDQTLVCFRLLCPFSEVINHNIGVPWLFKMTIKPDTCLSVMTKNSLFSCFMAVFMSYCQEFCGSKMIYMFESHDQAIVVFAYYGRFHELLPIFLGFQGDLK